MVSPYDDGGHGHSNQLQIYLNLVVVTGVDDANEFMSVALG